MRVVILESLQSAVCNPSATPEEKNARAIVPSYTDLMVVGVQLPNLLAPARIDISRAGAFALGAQSYSAAFAGASVMGSAAGRKLSGRAMRQLSAKRASAVPASNSPGSRHR